MLEEEERQSINLKDEYIRLTAEVNRLEADLKGKEKLIRETKAKFDKEKALLDQKYEFSRLEIKELQHKLSQNEEYNNMIMQFTDKKTPQEEKQDQLMRNFQTNMDELQINHKKQIESKDLEMSKQKDHFESIIKQLNDRLSNHLEEQHSSFQRQVDEEHLSAQSKITSLASQVKLLEARLSNSLNEFNLEKQDISRRNEQTLERIKFSNLEEIRKLNADQDEQISIIKSTYEDQMSQIESIYNQKARMKKSEFDVNGVSELLYEEIRVLKAERETYSRQLSLQKNTLTSKIIQLEERAKQLELLNTERQEDFARILKLHEENYQKSLIEIRDEKSLVILQLENQLNKTLELEKGREQTSIEIKQVQDRIRDEKEEIERQKTQSLARNQFNEKELQEQRGLVAKLRRENIEIRIQLESALAQSTERDRYYSDELSNLNKKIAKQEKLLEDRVSELARDHEIKHEQQVQKQINEKKAADKAIQKQQKEQHDIETFYKNKIQLFESELEGQKEIIAEQQQVLHRQEDAQKDSNLQFALIQKQLNEARADTIEKSNEVEKYKNISRHFNEKFNEAEAAFATQRLLNEQKVAFLEGQKERAKKDLIDAQQKFQLVLTKMQSIKAKEKSEQQSGTRSLMEALERRYDQKINDIKSDYEAQITVLESQIRLACSRADSFDSIKKATTTTTTSNNPNFTGINAGISPEIQSLIERMRKKELSLLEEIAEQKQENSQQLAKIEKQHQQEIQQLKTQLKNKESTSTKPPSLPEATTLPFIQASPRPFSYFQPERTTSDWSHNSNANLSIQPSPYSNQIGNNEMIAPNQSYLFNSLIPSEIGQSQFKPITNQPSSLPKTTSNELTNNTTPQIDYISNSKFLNSDLPKSPSSSFQANMYTLPQVGFGGESTTEKKDRYQQLDSSIYSQNLIHSYIPSQTQSQISAYSNYVGQNNSNSNYPTLNITQIVNEVLGKVKGTPQYVNYDK